MMRHNCHQSLRGSQAQGSRGNQAAGKTGRARKLLWASVAGVAVSVALALGVTLAAKRFLGFTPMDAMKAARGEARKDLMVVLQVAREMRNTLPSDGLYTNAVMRFLDLRYGDMTEATNRQRAFLNFFNVEHIEALYLMTGNRTGLQERNFASSIAQTVASYRQIMLPEEKEALREYFRSAAGRAQVRKATDCYRSKDVRFRDVSAPVIRELLATLALLEQP